MTFLIQWWSLPACSYSCLFDAQVVAITVFLVLSVAFYAFFAPFLGKDIYEFMAIGVYSFLVRKFKTPLFNSLSLSFNFLNSMSSAIYCSFLLLSNFCYLQASCVFILYARCTAIDPADPGILIEAEKTSTYRSHNDRDIPG